MNTKQIDMKKNNRVMKRFINTLEKTLVYQEVSKLPKIFLASQSITDFRLELQYDFGCLYSDYITYESLLDNKFPIIFAIEYNKLKEQLII
jgi:hypothetical protein